MTMPGILPIGNIVAPRRGRRMAGPGAVPPPVAPPLTGLAVNPNQPIGFRIVQPLLHQPKVEFALGCQRFARPGFFDVETKPSPTTVVFPLRCKRIRT